MERKIESNNKDEVSDIVEIGDGVQAATAQATSSTKLEEDLGEGDAAIIRMFEFAVNFETLKKFNPTKQELFNSHLKGIEVFLWKDGLKLMPEIAPKLTFNKQMTKYRIFVVASPMKGHLLREKPQTLKEIVV